MRKPRPNNQFCVREHAQNLHNLRDLRFPHWLKGYLTYVLPCLIILVFVMGYVERLSK